MKLFILQIGLGEECMNHERNTMLYIEIFPIYVSGIA